MRHVSDDRWDEALEHALQFTARELRTDEIVRANTDDAWARFVRERDHGAAPSRRPTSASIRRRAWVPVVALALVAATILGLVLLSNRPAVQHPTTVSTTTVTVATSVPTSSTQPTPVDGSSALVLPTFPDGKLIESLSAVSDSEWFALSDLGPPGQQYYPKLWRTTDAGATWVDMLLPNSVGGRQLLFADPLNGWIIDNQCCMLATHDGGATWALVAGVLPRGDAAWPAVALSGGRVHVFGDVAIAGNSRIGVMSSPVGSDDFVWSGATMGDARWGLTPNSAQLVLSGESGWAIAYGVTPPPSPQVGSRPAGALRLVDGEWTEWEPPCADPLQGKEAYTTIQVPQILLGASSSGGNTVVVCAETTAGAPLRTFVSDDRGATFVEGAQLPEGVTMTQRSWIRVLGDGTVLLGVALDTGELVIMRGHESGMSWAMDTSFGGAGDFTTLTVTPTGRLVVVASVYGDDGALHRVVRSRADRGPWVRFGSD